MPIATWTDPTLSTLHGMGTRGFGHERPAQSTSWPQSSFSVFSTPPPTTLSWANIEALRSKIRVGY